jgi:hypothetical protein
LLKQREGNAKAGCIAPLGACDCFNVNGHAVRAHIRSGWPEPTAAEGRPAGHFA